MKIVGLKLNLGCGINLVSGNTWVNCDNSILAWLRRMPIVWNLTKFLIAGLNLPSAYKDYPKFKLINIKHKLPWDSNKFSFIYCSHVIEHMRVYELNKTLEEIYRVLEYDGRIRILTPDLDKLVNLYKSANLEHLDVLSENNSKIRSEFFNHFFYPRSHLMNATPTLLTIILENFSAPHKYIFDFYSLYTILEKVGFRDIQRVDPEHTQFPDAHLLDQHADISLHVEARKFK